MLGRESTSPAAHEQEKYQDTANPSSTHIRDMLSGQEPDAQSPEPAQENKNGNESENENENDGI
jgi:hypothetical protein